MWAAWVTVYNCQLCEKVFFLKSAAYLRSHIFATKRPTDKIKYSLETPFLSCFFIFYDLLNLNKDFRADLQCKSCLQLPILWKTLFFSNFEVLYLCNKTSDRQNKIFLRNAIPYLFFHILLLFKFKLRFQAQNGMWLQHPAPILALILCGWGGREGGLVIGWPRIKRSFQSHVGGGGAVQNVQEPNLHHFDQQI